MNNNIENIYKEIDDNYLIPIINNNIYQNDNFHFNNFQFCPCKDAQKLIYLNTGEMTYVNPGKFKLLLNNIKKRLILVLLNLSNKINRKLLKIKND
jgi:hypothetical protein